MIEHEGCKTLKRAVAENKHLHRTEKPEDQEQSKNLLEMIEIAIFPPMIRLPHFLARVSSFVAYDLPIADDRSAFLP